MKTKRSVPLWPDACRAGYFPSCETRRLATDPIQQPMGAEFMHLKAEVLHLFSMCSYILNFFEPKSVTFNVYSFWQFQNVKKCCIHYSSN